MATYGISVKFPKLDFDDSEAIEPEEYLDNELGANALGSLLLTAALQNIVAKRLHIASTESRIKIKQLNVRY